MNFRQRRTRKPQVMLVSLVDVVLQLVLFLLLTSSFHSDEGAIDILLPRTEGDMTPVSGEILIEVDRHGEVTFEGRSVTTEELENFFRTGEAETDDRTVVIRADRFTRHGDVVAIMDLARRHDFRRLSVAAVSEKPSSGTDIDRRK